MNYGTVKRYKEFYERYEGEITQECLQVLPQMAFSCLTKTFNQEERASFGFKISPYRIILINITSVLLKTELYILCAIS